MEIVTKSLPELTEAERKTCSRLNYGWGGYMLELLHDYEDDPEAYSILLKNDTGLILGWALLVPTKYLAEYNFEVTYYARKRAKYAAQFYVRSRQRGKGYGKMLMEEALKIEPRPFVWPHDETSGAFFKKYKVRASLKRRKEHMKCA